MFSARFGFTGLALVATLFLSGCQNTITSIQLPNLSQVAWRAFVTGFTYENSNLTVQTTGSYIDAYLQSYGSQRYCGDVGTGEHLLVSELDSCPGGFTDFDVYHQYALFVEVESQFTSGSIVLMDGPDLVRSIPITTGPGSQIAINYTVGEGFIDYPFSLGDLNGSPEPYFEDNFTFLVMFPADPNFRSNISPEIQSEEELLNLFSSGQALCLSGTDLGEGPIEGENPIEEGSFDMIFFDIARGNGTVTCNVHSVSDIPTLSTWMLGGVALMIAGLGVAGMRRRQPR